MSYSLPRSHSIMLLKYAGISFISGAVNHGFFSGTRSLWTAGAGMALFVVGAWLEHLRNSSTQTPGAQGLLATLFWGAMLSIGLGFFTGGLQHFPDSPARSAWVVPLGFAVSVLALAVDTGTRCSRAVLQYALLTGLAVAGASWGTYRWLEADPQRADAGHSHAAPNALVAQTVTRSVAVHMDDSMRFMPDHIDVQTGEVIRFVLHNGGSTTHEFVLGDAKSIEAHAQQMRQAASPAHTDAHSHGAGAAISLGAGQAGEMVVGFSEPAQLQIACLIPGHYEAGMRGTLSVRVGSVGAAATNGASAHQHSSP